MAVIANVIVNVVKNLNYRVVVSNKNIIGMAQSLGCANFDAM